MKFTYKEEKTGAFLKQLFRTLREHNVTYCILGGYDGLPYVFDNDLDIWVKDGEQVSFKTVLTETANHLNWKIITPNVSPRLSCTGEGKYYLVPERKPIDFIAQSFG